MHGFISFCSLNVKVQTFVCILLTVFGQAMPHINKVKQLMPTGINTVGL